MRLSRGFYRRDTVTVARELLGKRLVRRLGSTVLSGTITETEAYGSSDDPASHAYRGPTARNAAMFDTVGCAYVYFTYGMHYCFNVVARSDSIDAGAVLIRAISPEKGVSIMIKNRKKDVNIADGPAKLAQAMKITKRQYGTDLTRDKTLFIADGPEPQRITSSRRIGISAGASKPWNFAV